MQGTHSHHQAASTRTMHSAVGACLEHGVPLFGLSMVYELRPVTVYTDYSIANIATFCLSKETRETGRRKKTVSCGSSLATLLIARFFVYE